MDAGRKVRNRLEGLGTKGLACSICLPALLVLLCTAIAQTGPNVLIVRKAGLNAVDVDFSSETFTRCGVNYDGTTLPQQIPRCWNHVFNFNSRWTQYFDVQLWVRPPKPGANVTTIPLWIEWYGQKVDGLTGSPTGEWETVFNGTVKRPVQCSRMGCWPVLAFRTSTVSYATYFTRIRVPTYVSEADVRATLGVDTDIVIRYRNPDFAMFELGFKVFFMLVSVVVALWYMAGTGCDWGCCPPTFHTGVGCLASLASRLCCRRGTGVSAAPLFVVPLGFRGQARVNWMYALLIGLVLYNQPLLWAAYYAPYDLGSSPASNGVPLLNVACQLVFVALLAAYWLVEFGLLAAASGNVTVGGKAPAKAPAAAAAGGSGVLPTAPSEGGAEGGVQLPEGSVEGEARVVDGSSAAAVSSPQKRHVSTCAFYGPKLAAILVYWLMAMSLYGHILARMQADPLYDWVAEGTEAAAEVGAGTIDSSATLVAWTLILACGYMVYIIWLVSKAACGCKGMSLGERFLFAFHLLTVLATAFGLAGSAVYGADVTSPGDFTFFVALYNGYVWTLVWMYSPQVVSIPGLSLPGLSSAYGPLVEVRGGGGEGGRASTPTTSSASFAGSAADAGLDVESGADKSGGSSAASSSVTLDMLPPLPVTPSKAAPPTPLPVAPLSAHAVHGRREMEAQPSDHAEAAMAVAKASGAAYGPDQVQDWGTRAAAAKVGKAESEEGSTVQTHPPSARSSLDSDAVADIVQLTVEEPDVRLTSSSAAQGSQAGVVSTSAEGALGEDDDAHHTDDVHHTDGVSRGWESEGSAAASSGGQQGTGGAAAADASYVNPFDGSGEAVETGTTGRAVFSADDLFGDVGVSASAPSSAPPQLAVASASDFDSFDDFDLK